MSWAIRRMSVVAVGGIAPRRTSRGANSPASYSSRSERSSGGSSLRWSVSPSPLPPRVLPGPGRGPGLGWQGVVEDGGGAPLVTGAGGRADVASRSTENASSCTDARKQSPQTHKPVWDARFSSRSVLPQLAQRAPSTFVTPARPCRPQRWLHRRAVSGLGLLDASGAAGAPTPLRRGARQAVARPDRRETTSRWRANGAHAQCAVK